MDNSGSSSAHGVRPVCSLFHTANLETCSEKVDRSGFSASDIEKSAIPSNRTPMLKQPQWTLTTTTRNSYQSCSGCETDNDGRHDSQPEPSNSGVGQRTMEAVCAPCRAPGAIQGDTAPYRITLASRLTTTPNISILLLMAGSMAITSFIVYYRWNTSFSSNPSARFRWDQPDNIIFTVSLLSHFTVILLSNLITAACDKLRWIKCCTKEGMPFLSFLALSHGTPISGLIQLLFSPVPRLSSFWSLGHRFWALQRYCHP